MAQHIYGFEDLSEPELPRMPLCALRALRVAGVALSGAGWTALPVDARHELAAAGAGVSVSAPEVHRILGQAKVSELKLVPKVADPSTDAVPAAVAGALGPTRPITLELWRAMSGLDRFVLLLVAGNARLIWRAVAEIAPRSRFGGTVLPSQVWTGTLAHAEVHMDAEVVQKLWSPKFLDGRGCILARVAGIRAARWVSEIMDLQAAKPTGPVEVGYSYQATLKPGTIIWQAHVSTLEGEFSPPASMLAVMTAAAALHDIAAQAGGNAVIESARLVDEAWQNTDEDDDVTLGFAGRR